MDEIEEIPAETVEIPAEQPVEVHLEDERSKEERRADKRAAKEASRQADEPSDEREQQLIEIKRQYEEQKRRAEAERNARQQAEAYAYEQAQKAQYAQHDAEGNRLQTYINAIEATEQAASNAERAYADAMASGDYQAAGRAQRAMASAEAHLLRLQNEKSQAEQYIESLRTEGRVQAPPRPNFEPQGSQQDPVEAMAARLTPKSAAWLRNNPEAASQVEKLTAAHAAAVQLKGLKVESPEYFRYVEKKLGIGQPDEPRAEKPMKRAMASAPVQSSSSMSSSRSSGGNGSTMVLSPAEVEQAILNEPDLPRDKALETYARNKAALIREGKIHA
jgi:hypothetical protein